MWVAHLGILLGKVQHTKCYAAVSECEYVREKNGSDREKNNANTTIQIRTADPS